jgi:hypothetical protein
MPEPVKVTDLGAEAGGGQGVDAAQAHQPPRGLRPRRCRQRSGDLGLELLAADHQSRDGAAIVLQRALRRGLIEPDAGQPPEMRLRPVGLRTMEVRFERNWPISRKFLENPMAAIMRILRRVGGAMCPECSPPGFG